MMEQSEIGVRQNDSMLIAGLDDFHTVAKCVLDKHVSKKNLIKFLRSNRIIDINLLG